MPDDTNDPALEAEIRALFAERASLADAIQLDIDERAAALGGAPSNRRRPLAVLTAFALAAAAITAVVFIGRQSPPETSVRTVTPIEALALVQQGSDRSRNATNFAFSSTLEISGIPEGASCQVASATTTGRVDVAQGLTEAERDGSTVSVSDGSTIYVRSDVLPSSFGLTKPWTKVTREQRSLIGPDLEKAGVASFYSLFIFEESLDPTNLLETLQGAAASVETIGVEDVGGAATHVVVRLDPVRFNELMNASLDRRIETEKTAGTTDDASEQSQRSSTIAPQDVPVVDAWIGDDGYVHQLRLRDEPNTTTGTTTGTPVPPGGPIFALTMTFTDYDSAPLQVGVPPSDQTGDAGSIPAGALDPMAPFTQTCAAVPAEAVPPQDFADCLRADYLERVGAKTVDEVLSSTDPAGLGIYGAVGPGFGIGCGPAVAVPPGMTIPPEACPPISIPPAGDGTPTLSIPPCETVYVPVECVPGSIALDPAASVPPTLTPIESVCVPCPSFGAPSTTTTAPATPTTTLPPATTTDAPSTEVLVPATGGCEPADQAAVQACVDAMATWEPPPSNEPSAPPVPPECVAILTPDMTIPPGGTP